MRKILFEADNKLSDLLVACHSLILVLPRFGICLGFGEKSVDEVCRQYGVDTVLFLKVCNIYAFAEYEPEVRTSDTCSVKALISYLLQSHSYYLEQRIPHIGSHLDRIARQGNPKQGDTLRRFFLQYLQEVENHFRYEENDVFPYACNLLAGAPTKGFTIHQFEENHSNIEDKLDDLTNIIIKYLPGDTLVAERTSVLFDLFQLSDDLKKHAFIENHLLVPYVEMLEMSRS